MLILNVLLATFALGNIGDVRLKGYLGDRLDSMIARHVGGTDIDYITAAFLEKTERHGWWQTEFWGKYMHSAVPYAVYSGSPKIVADIERGVDRILASQESSGYIGNYPDELRCGDGWDVWGMKYTMLGLIHYAEWEKDSARRDRAVAACRKLCDYLIAELGPGGRRGRALWETGNWSGYASSSVLEPVMWLYRLTGDGRYLDFASYIVEGMEKPEQGPRLVDLALKGVSVSKRNLGPYDARKYVCKRNRWKAYEMMSCYQGMLEYYQVKGGDRFLEAAVKTGEDIAGTEINLAGGCASSEAWFHGADKQHLAFRHLQETCVTTTWMRFCEKLLELTDDPKWADEIERTFYNAYLGALKADGSRFAAYTPLSGRRWAGMDHCYMHTDCCTANGPRGFLVFLKELCHRRGNAATFNFYATATVPGFDMYSRYPRQDFVRIVSHTEGALRTRFRIPGWTAKAVVKLNGKELEGVKPGAYFTLEHEWKLGDVVELFFDMPVIAHRIRHNLAFTRGPVLLARDSRFQDGDMMEPFRSNLIGDGQRMDSFRPVSTPSEGIWMTFAAALPIGSHSENPEAREPEAVLFCDYASAGNEWRKGNYYRTWFPEEYGPEDAESVE